MQKKMPRLKILLFIYAKLTVQILNKYGRNIISDSTILKETIKKDLIKKIGTKPRLYT